MHTITTIAQVLVLVAYLATAFVYLRYYITHAKQLRPLCRLAWLGALALHVTYLALLGAANNGLPLISVGHTLTTMVAAIGAMYLVIEWRVRRRAIGVFVLALVVPLQLLSGFLVSDSAQVPDTLRTAHLPLHALPAVLGYAGLGLGAVLSSLMLMLRRQIKRRRIGRLYRRLPPLRVLDTMAYHATAMGFALLTLGVLTGLAWAAREWNDPFPTDPKVLAALVFWLLYAVYVASRWVPGWGRRARALTSTLGFAALTLSTILLELLVESRHSW